MCTLHSKTFHVDFISVDSENIGQKSSIIFMPSFIVIIKSQFISKFLLNFILQPGLEESWKKEYSRVDSQPRSIDSGSF